MRAKWFGWCVAMLSGVLTTQAADQPKVKALMLTQSLTFTHGPVNRKDQTLAPAEIVLTQLGQQTGLFDLTCTQNAAADITKENLQKYQLLIFFSQGVLPIADADLDYLVKEWLPIKGHAFVGFHSTTDTLGDDQRYWDMIGGTFDGHPWNAGETVAITVHDPDHPAMKPLGAEFQIKDEIYQYKQFQPEKVRVLMSLNMEKCPTKKPYHVPVSWVKNYGEGRVFYTNLGHNESTWTNPKFIEHATGGIRWAMGLEPGDATPNPQLSKEQGEKAQHDTAAAEKK